jgi:hypothetical protein
MSISRAAKTVPPPPAPVAAIELGDKIRELRDVAASILARANDLEEVKAWLEGQR